MRNDGETVTSIIDASHVPALTLLSPDRFDVVAKYIYAKWRLRHLHDEWPRRLYLDHIAVFNGFFEADGSGKHGQAGFLDAFDALIDSLARDGFDAKRSRVPTTATGDILNGAHRLAASLALGIEVAVVSSPDATAYVYDHRWFQERGLALHWADAIATEACRLLPGSFVVVIYPSATGQDARLESIISARTRIWYRKSLELTDNGALNLVQQIYRRELWVGGVHNDFKGARDKKNWCFARPGPIRVYLVESELEIIRELKAEIRAVFGIDNHSVHINDTHQEAQELAGLLFNENSARMLNLRSRKSLPWFDALLPVYAKALSATRSEGDFCVDGSSVLAVHGMRDVSDIDFMHDSRIAPPSFAAAQISSHNAHAHWYECSPEAMVHDPRLHFYFDNLKFACMELVRDMKVRRGEAKDIDDIALIDDWKNDRTRPSSIHLFSWLRRELSWRSLYQRARFLKLRLRLWRHGRRR